jgi:DNA-binding response OmpR family regulator
MSLKSKILVVEDDQRLAKLLSQELSFEGHEVVPVHTGTDALLQAEEGKFDLIVLDRAVTKPRRGEYPHAHGESRRGK